MALYLGTDKLKINLDGVTYLLNFVHETFVTNGVVLLSSDNCILRDYNGIYLLPKEETIYAVSLDDYMLTDINGIILTIKESE